MVMVLVVLLLLWELHLVLRRGGRRRGSYGWILYCGRMLMLVLVVVHAYRGRLGRRSMMVSVRREVHGDVLRGAQVPRVALEAMEVELKVILRGRLRVRMGRRRVRAFGTRDWTREILVLSEPRVAQVGRLLRHLLLKGSELVLI